MRKQILAYGKQITIECDEQCNLEQWNEEYDGGDAKPTNSKGFNKWCFRSCSRCHEVTQ